jgi:hypothetical protein
MRPEVMAAYFAEMEELEKQAIGIPAPVRAGASWAAKTIGGLAERASTGIARASHKPVNWVNKVTGEEGRLAAQGYTRTVDAGLQAGKASREGVTYLRPADQVLKDSVGQYGWADPRGTAQRVSAGVQSFGRMLDPRKAVNEIRQGWHSGAMTRYVDKTTGKSVDAAGRAITRHSPNAQLMEEGAGVGMKAVGVGMGAMDFAASAKQDPNEPQKGFVQRMGGAAGRTAGFFAGQRGGMISAMVASELAGRTGAGIGKVTDSAAGGVKAMHQVRKQRQAREAAAAGQATPRSMNV